MQPAVICPATPRQRADLTMNRKLAFPQFPSLSSFDGLSARRNHPLRCTPPGARAHQHPLPFSRKFVHERLTEHDLRLIGTLLQRCCTAILRTNGR
jgi:hypothetical protein